MILFQRKNQALTFFCFLILYFCLVKYYILFISFLVNIGCLFAQDGRLNLVSSSYSNVVDKKGLSSINPVYEHKGNTLSADSGIVYEDEIKRQFFEAFGNIVITQPSGTVIYADRLHYDAAAQLAKLTGNVKMVDKNSVLTTNYLTYNMRSKIGTYTGGGRIITQTDTITSKNAYYFENSGDAYFRHKVIVRNPSVKVYTDSMRYNGISKNTYFFGPTNIKGNKDENLYTESGVYNTATGIANFNKENLYNEGSKFLNSDSLHYNRETGIGIAIGNVVFVDTLDKFYAYGGKGEYTQRDESILMTDKPYIITVVKNDNDSTSTDSTSTETPIVANNTAEVGKKKEIQESKTEVQKTEQTISSVTKLEDEEKTITSSKPKATVDSVYMTADTLFSRIILAKEYIALDLKLDREGGQLIEETEEDYGDEDGQFETDSNDSTKNISGNLQTIDQDPKKLEKPKTEVKTPVTSTTKTPAKTNNNHAEGRKDIEHTLKADSVLRQKAVVPEAGHAGKEIDKALKIAQQTDVKDSTKTEISDTARTRIVKAYYNVRLFKSDLQAVADSVYYGMQDSMFRFMGRPMIWAEDSQISADTIYMQILNQKMDNALLKENAFMVNALSDSTKFNQLKGRKITAFFANNNIERLFVDGNAENLVFSVNDKTNRITEMFHDRGARIKVYMENKKIIDYKTIKKVDQKVYPFKMVTAENEVLSGFIWRPQDRPKSKEDLLNRKRELPKEQDEKESNQEGDKLSEKKIDESKTEEVEQK